MLLLASEILQWPLRQLFYLAYGLTQNVGWSIVLLSVASSTFLLPLYRWGDKIQRRELRQRGQLQSKLDELRSAFSGATLHMLQKTLYRQRGYRPVYALRAGFGALLQLPVFVAAYQFIKGLPLLEGQVWGPIANLARPDSLLFGGGNLLPWLMTLLNLFSGSAYLAAAPQSNAAARWQLWGTALLFLLLLYREAAGLLLYWTCSNLYSLAKNLWLLPAPKRYFLGLWRRAKSGLAYLCWGGLPPYALLLLGLFLLARFKILDSVDPLARAALRWGLACCYAVALWQVLLCWRQKKRVVPALSLAALVLAQLWWQLPAAREYFSAAMAAALTAFFVVAAAALPLLGRLAFCRPYLLLRRAAAADGDSAGTARDLALAAAAGLLGLLLFNSSALLYSSPSESPAATRFLLWPLWPLTSTSLLLLVFWTRLKKVSARAKRERAWPLLATANNFVWQPDYGSMTNWVFERPQRLHGTVAQLLRAVALLVLLYYLWLALLRRRHIFVPLCWLVAASLWSGSAYYSARIWQFRRGAPPAASAPEARLQQVYSYSKRERNVLIIMLDRFVGPYLGDILQLEPQIAASLGNFTWYKNTTSPGPYTISGLTALLGGQQYTPENLAKQEGSLRQKINRAYLLLPKLFANNGYNATVSDPSWADFYWRGNLKLFHEQGINATHLKGRYNGLWLQRLARQPQGGGATAAYREPNYAVLILLQAAFRALPPPLAPLLYDNGSWLGGNFPAAAKFKALLDTWSTLVHLPQISDAAASEPQFIMMTNDTPHEPLFMGYVPDDARYPLQPLLRPGEESASSPLPPRLQSQLRDNYARRHFYANWATMREISRYLIWLRQQDVYDNSLIIVASDHGRDVTLAAGWPDYGYYMPLLLVKMPGKKSGGREQTLTIDLSARSIADVPALASMALAPAKRLDPFSGQPLLLGDPAAPRYAHYIGQNPNSQKRDRFIIEKTYRIAGPIWQKASWREVD